MNHDHLPEFTFPSPAMSARAIGVSANAVLEFEFGDAMGDGHGLLLQTLGVDPAHPNLFDWVPPASDAAIGLRCPTIAPVGVVGEPGHGPQLGSVAAQAATSAAVSGGVQVAFESLDAKVDRHEVSRVFFKN